MHIENLKVGDFVAVIEDNSVNDNPFYSSVKQFDGLPWEVSAISVPFVAIFRGGRTASIDTRRFGLTKVSKAYVAAMAEQSTVESTEKRRRSRRKIKTKRDPRDCVRCGERMVQRIPKSNNPMRQWHYICPGCGFDHGPSDSPSGG